MSSKPVTRYKDIDTGHGPFLPVPALGLVPPKELPDELQASDPIKSPFACSGNVFAGTRGVHRANDVRIPHVSSVPPFPPEVSINPSCYSGSTFPWLREGSKSVLANGKGIGRIGDPVICGSTILTGDISVLIGD